MNKMRQAKADCLTKLAYEQKSQAEQLKISGRCQRAVVETPSALWQSFTPEEAYLFVARFYYDQFSEINGASLGLPFVGTGLDVNSESLSVPGDDTDESKNRARMYCHLLDKKPAVTFLDLQENAKRYCREVLNVPVTYLREKPLTKTANCRAFYWLDVGTKDGRISGMVLSRMDQDTGAVLNERFAGTITLLHSQVGEDFRGFGLGNREFESVNIYRLTPESSVSREELIWLLQTNAKATRVSDPGVFISLSLRKDGRTLVLDEAQQAAEEILTTQLEDILGVNVRLQCLSRETNLPEEAWYIY